MKWCSYYTDVFVRMQILISDNTSRWRRCFNSYL